MTVVGPGVYHPFYPTSNLQQEVAMVAFGLDRTPVTNREFLAFVKANPKWRRAT